jgi:CRISPR-associated endoribonuclease cas2
MKFVIAYDIQSDKNRKKLSDILEGIGYRVNFSVFECELNETKLKKLIKDAKPLLNTKTDNTTSTNRNLTFSKDAKPLLNTKTDSLRFYRLCENCVGKSFELCDKPAIFEIQELFV